MSAFDNFFFVALPYVAAVVFLVGAVYRYRVQPFKISSLSSQFLENGRLSWGSLPFHEGMVAVILLHLAALFFPNTLLAWNSRPVRLIALEITGFVFALGLLYGLIVLFFRRVLNSRIRAVTTWADVFVELLLLYQVISGCIIALNYRWGSSWFASDLSPYLWSLAKFNPHTDAIKAMPSLVRSHVVGAFLTILIFPFTRLMHLLVTPFDYPFRPEQQVIWNWDRKAINDPASPWDKHGPGN